jgi:hypothetical protein
MEVESIGSLKVRTIFESVRTPVALLAGSIEAITGGVLSGSVAVKLKVTAELKGFPTTSVMKVEVSAVMTAPTVNSAPPEREKDAVLFASLYSTVPLEIGVPFESTVSVVFVIVDASIDSSNVNVMLTLAGAVAVLGNWEATEGGTASIIPVTGVTTAFGTVTDTAEMRMLAVLAAGPAAAPLKVMLKVQDPPAATFPVKQFTSATWKSALFVP